MSLAHTHSPLKEGPGSTGSRLIILIWGLELLQSKLLALLMWELESTRGLWKNPSSPQGLSKAFSSGTQPNPPGRQESHPLYPPSSHEA